MNKATTFLHDITRDFHKYATLNNAVLAIAIFIALGWIWGSVDALGRNYKYQQQVDAARAQVELLGLQNQNLQAEQSYLQSNEYLEIAARAKLNKAMPGEKLVLLPPTVASSGSASAGAATPPDDSNFTQWMDFLFGKHAQTADRG